MRHTDRVVLVTGGSAGIGEATAIRFCEEGAQVAVIDVNQEAGEKVVQKLGERGAFYKASVADYQEIQETVDQIGERFGRIDVLVNNAGITRDSQLVKYKDGQVVGKMSEADFDLVISVNLKGVFNCTQAVVPHMIRQGGGVILNSSSVVGRDGNFGQTNYVATKAGVVGFTKVWSRELGKYNIRVNAVAPGFTLTDMVRAMPEKVLDGMRARTPLGRLADPVDIANAYVFLASDEASFITGETLHIDGGILIGT